VKGEGGGGGGGGEREGVWHVDEQVVTPLVTRGLGQRQKNTKYAHLNCCSMYKFNLIKIT